MQKSRTILYVEDHAVSIVLMDMIIQQLGDFSMVSAMTAEEGFVMACEIQPAVLLIDIDLPGMNGIEFMHRICSVENLREMPMIAVSAMDDDEIIEEALAIGCQAYIDKPVDIQKITEIICGCLNLPVPCLDAGL